MTIIHYPEKELQQDQDLEAFFHMREQHINEAQARQILSLTQFNAAMSSMENPGGFQYN